MSVKRVDPGEAATLVAEGWTYLDVRSVPEFDEGHPAGAYNVPFLHRGPGGMTPNPGFAAAASARFAKDHKLVVGCKSGGRSQKACAVLEGLGFTQLIDVRGGFGGEVDGIGQVTCEGWQARGLPVETTAAPGHRWTDLEAK